MGRGRAKAKQTKVARQLKYNSPEMDIESLQRELAAQQEGDSRDYEEMTHTPTTSTNGMMPTATNANLPLAAG